jgi:hypothetical protein
MSLAKVARSMNRVAQEQQPTGAPAGRSVFISYARQDQEIARRFVAWLAASGYVPWWDDSIEGGAAFEDRIVRAIDACLAVAVIWTPRSVGATWVKFEAAQGHMQNKLVPLAAAGLDLRHIRPPFSDLHTLPIEDEPRILRTLQTLQRGRTAA